MASSRRRSKNRTFLIGQSPPRRGLASASSGQYTCRSLSCCHITSSEPYVLPERNNFHLGKSFSGKADGVVGRAIINQDDFAIGIALAERAPRQSLKNLSPFQLTTIMLTLWLFSPEINPCQDEAEPCLPVMYPISAQYSFKPSTSQHSDLLSPP